VESEASLFCCITNIQLTKAAADMDQVFKYTLQSSDRCA